jgi:hypothetical protein
MLSLYSAALGRASVAPRVIQLPFDPAARWVGLPFEAPPAIRPRAGQVSIALLDGAPPGVGATWSGLLLDEWVELIPNPSEDAGVVFHYDRPGAEAPQALLVAVPPHAGMPWSLELLMRTLAQTFETVKTRGFDGEWKRADNETGHALYDNPWLPLILLAEADPDATISSSFGSCVPRGAGG